MRANKLETAAVQGSIAGLSGPYDSVFNVHVYNYVDSNNNGHNDYIPMPACEARCVVQCPNT